MIRGLWLTVMLFVPVLAAFAQAVSTTRTDRSDDRASKDAEAALTPAQLSRSRAWGLSEVEWQRYQSLMLGIRGSVSHQTLSPIEVLGIHARDAGERRRYAELWARAMFEDAERILAFQRAYDEAARQLNPGLLLIDTEKRQQQKSETASLDRADRVLFFTAVICPPCDAVLSRLMKRLDGIAGIDIYVTQVDGSGDEAIREWAAAHAIEADWVRSGRVTLNHDRDVLSRIGEGTTSVPALFVRRDDQIRRLAYGAL